MDGWVKAIVPGPGDNDTVEVAYGGEWRAICVVPRGTYKKGQIVPVEWAGYSVADGIKIVGRE